ncbi:MAG TPA: phosphate ABC transporter permease PstA [Nitrososphaera sp.]|nr:phosphate ABC transporter permease PstA [Nitrososphaera sp.]
MEQNEKSSETFGSDHSNRRHRVDIQQMMDKQSIRRRLLDKIATGVVMACVIAAIIPLGSILIEVVKNGSGALNLEFLTQPPGAIGSGSGGIGPAIQGTLIVIALASLIGAPAGVLAGIYLSEFAGSGRFPYAIRFLNDVLTGLPSIVVGIVGFVVIVLTIGSFSVWAGAFALSIIMVPIVVRVTEETLKLVPNSIREAGYSLGIPKWKVVMFIVLTSAKSGVLTGIVLALSRISGETAPLIMTILGTSLFFTGFADPVDALPLRIWRLASQPYESAHSFGWGAALILIILVLAMSVGLRMLAYKKGFRIKTMSI